MLDNNAEELTIDVALQGRHPLYSNPSRLDSSTPARPRRGVSRRVDGSESPVEGESGARQPLSGVYRTVTARGKAKARPRVEGRGETTRGCSITDFAECIFLQPLSHLPECARERGFGGPLCHEPRTFVVIITVGQGERSLCSLFIVASTPPQVSLGTVRPRGAGQRPHAEAAPTAAQRPINTPMHTSRPDEPLPVVPRRQWAHRESLP